MHTFTEDITRFASFHVGSTVARWFVFKPKFPIWRVLQWKILVYFTAVEYFVVIWYISPCFGILYQEKSGNPGGLLRGPNEKRVLKVDEN
jgi:hypothetical protein